MAYTHKGDREIINRGTGVYEVQCAVCEKWFESMRYDASFCSSTCRSRYNRSLAEADKLIAAASKSVAALVDRLPRTGASKTESALKDLRALIDRALASVESE